MEDAVSSFDVTVTDANGATASYEEADLESCTKLPIDLISFDAVESSTGNTITWVTASEYNVSNFELLRSQDGFHFEPIAEQSPRGNSNQGATYSQVDQNLDSDINYYQLKTIDFDGSSSLSQIVHVNRSSTITAVLFPIPASNELQLDLNLRDSKEINWTIIDVTGKQIQTMDMMAAQGTLNIDISTLSTGTYFLELLVDGQVSQYQFLKN